MYLTLASSVCLYARCVSEVSEEGSNFQPITELLYKIARSRNLAFPAQSADVHACPDWRWLRQRPPERASGALGAKIIHVM